MDRLGLLPFFKICLFWCLGILLYAYFPIIPVWIAIASMSASFVAISIFVFGKMGLLPSRKWLFIALVGLLFSSLSYTLLCLQSPIKNQQHLLNSSYKTALLEITKSTSQTKASYKSEAKVLSILNKGEWKNAEGKVLLYFLDSLEPNLKIGNQLLIDSTDIARISQPSNPEQFNYAKYMAKKGTFHQAFIRPEEYKIVSTNEKATLVGFFEKARQNLLEKLAYLSPETKPVAEALLLGYKENLTDNVREIFSKTGTMHILAVSGLHVGIIYKAVDLFLMFLLGIRYGKPLKISLVLLCLWSYAFLTGMPPSVLRACIMFSFITLGASLNRPNNIFNNVLASAFFLLVIKPNLLFDVSFQLSYAAVFGIIGFQPYLAQFFRPKNGIIKFFWDLITVSFAAQIATLPFTLYYFNQMPLIFPISNLIAIPGAFLIVGMGALLLLVNTIGGQLQSAIEAIYQLILDFLVGGIDLLSSLPFATLEHIVISLSSALFLFLIVATLPFAIRYKNKNWLFAFLVILCAWAGVAILEKQNNPRAEFVVFDTKRQSVFGQKSKNHSLIILCDSLQKDVSFETEGWFAAYENVDTVYINSKKHVTDHGYLSKNLLHFYDITIALNSNTEIDKIDFYLYNKDYDFSKKINLEPEKCIFDASINSNWVLKNNPTFAMAHFVERDGAFVKNIP